MLCLVHVEIDAHGRYRVASWGTVRCPSSTTQQYNPGPFQIEQSHPHLQVRGQKLTDFVTFGCQDLSQDGDHPARPSHHDPHPDNRPFHAVSLDFGLDYVDFLDPFQLALAWVAHPDYDDMVGRPMHKAWHRARKEAEAAGKVGGVAVGPGEEGNWPDFAAIDLEWTIPTDLSVLPSEHLAVSQVS